MLVENWKAVAKQAWSVRLTLLAALSAVIGAVLPYVDKGGETFIILSAILAVCAALARVISQPSIHSQEQDK